MSLSTERFTIEKFNEQNFHTWQIKTLSEEKLLQGESVAAHVNNVRAVVDQLAGAGAAVNEEKSVFVLLASMLESYDQTVASIANQSKVTMADATAAVLIQEESRRKANGIDESPGGPSAFLATAQRKKWKPQECLCFYWKKPGHLIRDCNKLVSDVVQKKSKENDNLFASADLLYSNCPAVEALYAETGDISSLPLLCDYPVKSQFLKTDPAYLPCAKSECQNKVGSICIGKTCSGSLTFRLVNIRTDITFVFFQGGFTLPCVLKVSDPLQFARSQAPLYGHLSSTDSTGASMRLTWSSGDNKPQILQYAGGKSTMSTVTTFEQSDMCDSIPSPASDFGWHNPGYIHSAVMAGLSPRSTYSYRYGSDSVGWSTQKSFKAPPAAGSDSLTFIVYGDMGKAERDHSIEHYIQPGSLGVIKSVTDKVNEVDMVFHIGDISYATGFLAEWDFFLEMIEPVASKLPYMTAIGNHERDFPGSGSYYSTPDSGGECGVPYETYFQMPVQGKDKPWYSIESGPVHITVISTEHDWRSDSEQYKWIVNDLVSVDRTKTPWLIFTGHRPQYSSGSSTLGFLRHPVDTEFVSAIEPLLLQYQVDLALWGHVHNYERTCAVFQGVCKMMPAKGADGTDIYDSSSYSAPVHAVVGMSGFHLDAFAPSPEAWSLVRVNQFGYGYIDADKQKLHFQLIESANAKPSDSFVIVKS
ncbi:hypothetical protein O6H91_01G157300 [Diphasiastrum complanatum]|uniref:Uncharacterized protein n=1 Tax=Diphasiastrum complanatum TaxID=34168 RepID=A0ACC2EXL7_DIPCM|nr:hypothetical protein O6H91_01G157300 [Diphasiastrum complanatum]